MERRNYTKKQGGQVRGESMQNKKRDRQVRGEKTSGGVAAPVYTAVYKVNRSDELLEFLLRKCNTSRNNVKSLLVRKQVLVNGSVVTQYNFALAKDDEVKIAKKPMKDAVVAKNLPVKRVHGVVKSDLPIIYEDEDFIAIDKPCGLLSVESDKEIDCAYGHVLAYMQAKEKNARPFILHRIDKETSGVLVFAKNARIHSMLKMHWNEQVQTREYYAIVEGVPEKKADTIKSYLKENVHNLVYSTKDPSGQKAITRYEVMKENEQFALLKVEIDTGRKNQIRVHMKDIGHSIVGDEKYGYTEDPIGRLGLHASKLVFIHPITQELITLHAPLPATFYGLFS